MTNIEKAKIILEQLDQSSAPIQVNWNMSGKYMVAILEALQEIEKQENKYNADL